MGKIRLTPDTLLSQSAEMSTLQKEYDTLFSGVSGMLGDLNNNWSANLAHNFSGKITSAQSSFANIVEMLGNGSLAAASNANLFNELDSQLAKVMDGSVNSGSSGSAGSVSSASGSTDSTEAVKNDTLHKTLGVMKDANLGLFKDVASIAATICSMPGDLLSKGPVAFANDGWKLINSVFATGEDLFALVAIPTAYGVTKLFRWDGSTSAKAMESAIETAQEHANADSLSDSLEVGGCHKAATAAKGVDVISDGYSAYTGITGAYDTLTSIKDICHQTEMRGYCLAAHFTRFT